MVVPTGFGKSACYQIPSMLLPEPRGADLSAARAAAGSAPEVGAAWHPVRAARRNRARTESAPGHGADRRGRLPARDDHARDAGDTDDDGATRQDGGQPRRGRRGPLHLGVGLRLPARVPPHRSPAARARRPARAGADGDGHRAGARSDRHIAPHGRSGHRRGVATPLEPGFRGLALRGRHPRAGAGAARQAPAPAWHRLLRDAARGRHALRAAAPLPDSGPPLSRRHDGDRARTPSRRATCVVDTVR